MTGVIKILRMVRLLARFSIDRAPARGKGRSTLRVDGGIGFPIVCSSLQSGKLKLFAHRVQQSIKAIPREGRYGHPLYRGLTDRERRCDPAGQEIDLIENVNNRFRREIELSQDRVYSLPLLDRLRMAGVDHMEQEIGLVQLLEGRLKRRD